MRLTGLLIGLVALGIIVVAGLAYARLSTVTMENANIRIDRAAKSAVSIISHATEANFFVQRSEDGSPLALVLSQDSGRGILQSSAFYDQLLAEIGKNNQGAANLFVWNAGTQAFDRFATTFRRPDGSMPPPMAIAEGHPAYAALASNRPFVGEVPVMGRLRLAYLTPIVSVDGAIAGALAVDVGWTDDLTVARDELRLVLFGSALLVLVLVAGYGINTMRRALRPLRQLASFANDLAAGEDEGNVPFIDRDDEVGALAQGLARVARLQEDLEYLAYTDPMTGQGNRARYLRDLEAAIQAARNGNRYIVFHIDMVRFARVNAAYGSSTGDKVLRAAGDVICATLEQLGVSAAVARQGDDKFAVIVEETRSAVDVAQLAAAIRKALWEPMTFAKGDVQLDAAIGVCRLPEHAFELEEALRRLNLALSKALVANSDRVVMFSSDLSDETEREVVLEAALRKAIDDHHIDLHYQPQIDPQTGETKGLEALARWNHSKEGFVSPAEFIGIAERSGLIVALGDLVLSKACAQARHWLDEGVGFCHIAVNVSAVQLWQKDFVSKVEAALKMHGIDGRCICLEVTESIFADFDDTCIVSILCELRSLGVCLSLDDFGAGYSSLSYLDKMPFDQLKIDRAFVRHAPGDRQRERLLEGIVALGKGLGKSLVIEGAETVDEVMLARQLGVEAIQGFYFSRPVPAESLADVIHDIKRTMAAQAA